MFNSIRKIVFYGSDLLTGGKVQNNLKDINYFYNITPESKKNITANNLIRLIRNAAIATPFYQKYDSVTELARYPIILKKQIQNTESEFLSSRYKRSKLVKRETSGSYGTPMRVFFSREKRARQVAELIYYNKHAGLDIGELYINITTDKKYRIEKYLKNVITINPAVMTEKWYSDIIQLLQKYDNKVIIGFPSVLFPLANYIRNNTKYRNIRMKGIITIAEPLNFSIKDTIEDVFQCPVFSRYATMETGVIGHSIDSDNRLHINQASYIVEILSFDSDVHVDEGEAGRVIVTDLFSDAMPIIRYETGDTATLVSKNEFGATCIKNPEGRIIESIYNTEGTKISWAALYDIMSSERSIIQYQFCQKGRKYYQLNLVAPSKFSHKEERILKNKFMELLGSDAVIDFYYTDSIPALPSGKRPMIINTYLRESHIPVSTSL